MWIFSGRSTLPYKSSCHRTSDDDWGVFDQQQGIEMFHCHSQVRWARIPRARSLFAKYSTPVVPFFPQFIVGQWWWKFMKFRGPSLKGTHMFGLNHGWLCLTSFRNYALPSPLGGSSRLVSKWSRSPLFISYLQAMKRPFGRGTTLLRGLTNQGYWPLTNWDDPPSRWNPAF